MFKKFLTAKLSRKKLDSLISRYQTKNRVLEIGSRGQADYTKYFPNRIGVDIKEGKGVDVVASVYNLPFKESEFDVILCISVLEHLENPQKAVNEMGRVLKRGGILIVAAPFLFPMHDVPNDYWRFTKYGLKYLFCKGFVIEELLADTTPGEMFANLLQRLAYQTEMRLNKPSKFILHLLAYLLTKMPKMTKNIFGDIRREVKEEDAFSSGFFLVAKRV